LACDIKKKRDTKVYSFGHLTLILSLHYLAVRLLFCEASVWVIKGRALACGLSSEGKGKGVSLYSASHVQRL